MRNRTLIDLIVPEGLVLLAGVALVHWGAASPELAPLLRLLPLVVLAGGAFLGWRFQRGRLLLALTGLVIADRAMFWLAPPESDAPYAGPVVVRAIAILLTVSFAVLAFVAECGVFTPAGLRRIVVAALEVAALLALWLFAAFHPAATERAFDLVLVPYPALAWLPIGQPAAFVALLAIAVLAARTIWRPEAESRGFLWAAIATVVAASAGPASGRSTSYFAIAGLVLVVAAVESVYALAYHDELTGLPARRALNDALQRASGVYTVAMVDVDHFKKFNDTHGHDVGDQVLRMVASRLARVSGGGRAFRYGGEEFAVLFPGKSAEESAPHLEALRASVEGATFLQRATRRGTKQRGGATQPAAGGRKLAVTVSIGAAQARGAALPDDVVKAADQALYRAKEGGRNRVALTRQPE